jgi:hypothetical protein
MRLAVSVLVCSVLALAACNQDTQSSPTQDPAPAGTGLRGVAIAPNFTFKMTQGVHIDVSKKGTVSEALPLEIRNAGGDLLVQAHVDNQHGYTVDYPLPLGQTELFVKVGDTTQKVLVKDGTATVVFD